MKEQLIKFLTKENVTFALSIFGALGALFSFIKAFLINRKNLKIRIEETIYKKENQTLLISCIFENRSQLPISVIRFKLKINGKIYEPVKYPRTIRKYTNNEGKIVVDRIFIYNLHTPADISQLSAIHGYILFELPPEVFETSAIETILLVYSTRGRVQQIQLPHRKIEFLP